MQERRNTFKQKLKQKIKEALDHMNDEDQQQQQIILSQRNRPRVSRMGGHHHGTNPDTIQRAVTDTMKIFTVPKIVPI
jgi:adenylyl- and sulfurtransferase ThiI